MLAARTGIPRAAALLVDQLHDLSLNAVPSWRVDVQMGDAEAAAGKRPGQLARTASDLEDLLNPPPVGRESDEYVGIPGTNTIVELGHTVEGQAHAGIVVGRSLLTDLA